MNYEVREHDAGPANPRAEPAQFVCPSCHMPMANTEKGWHCLQEDFQFCRDDGIPSFILPHRRIAVESFLRNYQKIRSSEGWGSSDVKYYRDLPYRDRSGMHTRIWRIRARTFDCFLDHLLQNKPPAGMRILDIGAGNCWLAARLAQCGFAVVALDINLDPLDGLGALLKVMPQERANISPIRADFDALPFPRETFDVVIFNASLHYSTYILETLLRALSTLKEGGILYILDSPIYTNAGSGKLMIQERKGRFRQLFNLSIIDEFEGSFLTFDLFKRLEGPHRIEFLTPRYGLLWALRPLRAKVLRRREPATFKIIAVHKGSVQDSSRHEASTSSAPS